MKKMHIIVIRANTLDRETRATKIIRTLIRNGYQVSFLGWDRGIRSQRSEKNEAGGGFTEVNFRLRAPWGITSIFFLPIWWSYIFYFLMITEWDLVHAIQITTSPPAIIAGKIRGKPVVYDMLDTYEDSIIIPSWIRNILVGVNKFFLKLAAGVVLADDEQVGELNGIPNNNVIAIYDSPDTTQEINVTLKINENFTIFYAGLLYSGKHLNIDKMVEAIKPLDEVTLIIAGHGDMVPGLLKIAAEYPGRVDYIGEISHAQVLQMSTDADLLFVLRDPMLPVNRYICGSKILEAMMCGTPILVGGGTSTAKKVHEEQCGLIVNEKDILEIRAAIVNLMQDKSRRDNFSNKARRAFETKYCWRIMEEKLLKFYSDLLVHSN